MSIGIYDGSILIVDDEEIVLNSLKKQLRFNYNIMTANNGADAISILESGFIPDIILLDVRMPVMDGYEFLSYINNKKEYFNISVMIITGLDSVNDKLHGLKLGAIDYLVKPFSKEELRLKIKNILDKKRAHEVYTTEKLKNKILNTMFDSYNIELGSQQSDTPITTVIDDYRVEATDNSILDLLIEGLQNKEIAFKLNISENTIKKRISGI